MPGIPRVTAALGLGNWVPNQEAAGSGDSECATIIHPFFSCCHTLRLALVTFRPPLLARIVQVIMTSAPFRCELHSLSEKSVRAALCNCWRNAARSIVPAAEVPAKVAAMWRSTSAQFLPCTSFQNSCSICSPPVAPVQPDAGFDHMLQPTVAAKITRTSERRARMRGILAARLTTYTAASPAVRNTSAQFSLGTSDLSYKRRMDKSTHSAQRNGSRSASPARHRSCTGP